MADPAKFSDIQNGPDFKPFQSELSETNASIVPAFSVNQMTTLRASFEDDLVFRKQAGISAIGLWRKKIDDVGEAAAVEAVRKSGLDVTTLSFAGGFSGSVGFQFREALEDGYQALFTAAAVGARTLVISTGARARYTARHEFRLVTQAIRELSFLAEELGVQLAVMPRTARYAGRWTSLHSVEQALALCDATRRKNVGLVYHTFYMAEDPNGLHIAAEFADRVFVLQLSDAGKVDGPEYSQCLPGAGSLPIQETIQALYERGFSGDVDVEILSESIWKQDVSETLTVCQAKVQSLLQDCLSRSQSDLGMSEVQA